MASILKTLGAVFSERNVLVISITSMIYRVFNQFWRTWWSLYLLEIGATIPVLGLISMIQNSSNILFQLPGGILADRIGRKKTIMIGTGFRILAPIVMLLGRTWQQVLPGVIINATSSLYMPALNAAIAESLPFKERATAFGAYRMITSIPSIFMPMISGIFIYQMGIIDGVRFGLLMYLVAAIIAFAGRSYFLRETLFDDESSSRRRKPQTFRDALSTIQKLRGTILVMLVIACIGSFGMRMTASFYVVYATDVIQLTSTQWGLLLTMSTLFRTVTSLFGGILADKYGRIPFILFGRFLVPLRQIGLLLLRDFNKLLGLHGILGFLGGLGGGGMGGGGFMGGPAWSALVADVVPSRDRGKVMGLMATTTGLISLPAPAFGAYVWETYSPNTLLIVGAVTALSSIPVIILFLKEPTKRER